MRAATPLLFLMILPGACAAPGGPYPSLQPRAAEAIDPRVPVERPINDRPVAPALAAKLAEAVRQARGASGAFDSAADLAEKAAANAGAARGEGWIAAQEALSGAIAARKPVVSALADVDAIGAQALQVQGGLAPSDLAAIQAAATEIGALDRAQAARIDAIQRRLGP